MEQTKKMDRLEGIKKAIKQPLEGLLYDLDLMPEQCKTPINELRSSVVECQYKEIERLRKAYREYGNHKMSCECIKPGFPMVDGTINCTCGFNQAFEDSKAILRNDIIKSSSDKG